MTQPDPMAAFDDAAAGAFAVTRKALDVAAVWVWMVTDPDRRHLLRAIVPEIRSGIDWPAHPGNDVTLWVEQDPPTFWCDLPVEAPPAWYS